MVSLLTLVCLVTMVLPATIGNILAYISQDNVKSAKDINGINVISFAVEGVDVKTLREMVDKVKEKLISSVVVVEPEPKLKDSF